MTNRQWLMEQMQNMSDEEFRTMIFEDFKNEKMGCGRKICRHQDCDECELAWLKAEHKEPIKLSDAERVILENINKNFKWICRDEDGILSLFENKPVKNGNCWADSKGKYFELYVFEHIFNHLFQFIKWNDSEPYNIEELLK